jgi:Ca2+-binding RTX toxin-like protein
VGLARVVLIAVPLLALLAGSSVAQNPPPNCFGQKPTIVGGPGPDNMQGTVRNDVMVGEGGNDTMNGGGGNDLICGNDGGDTIRGGDGGDKIDGGTENDTLNGDAGDDTLDGSTGADVVQGGDGNDTVDGGGGESTDLLRGGPGNDTLIGKHAGEATPDEADYSQAGAAVNVDLQAGRATGEGNDTLQGIDWVAGSSFNDVLTGSGASNVINGGPGNDRIDGGPGGDLLSGDGGDDVVNGGSGTGTGVLDIDYLVYTNAPGAVRVDFVAGKTTGWGNDTVSGIEGVFGSKFNDVLIGDGDSLLWGQAGDDEIHGQRDDRALFSKPVDADLARGTATGEGNDKLIDVANLEGSSGNDKLTGDDDPNLILGGPGGNDTLSGGPGPDALVSGGPSTLSGGPGADRLEGRNGNDNLDGGTGDDLLSAGGGANTIDGGAGLNDTVTYFGLSKAVNVNLAQGIGAGDGTDKLVNVEGVVGSTHDDSITGDAHANSLQGGDGNDVLAGGAGPDFLDGGVGSNSLNGGPGSDYCLQKGPGCEVSGAPFIPGKAPLPPGVTPPGLFSFIPALAKRASAERELHALERQTFPPQLATAFPADYVLALSAQLAQSYGPAAVNKGETAAYKYAAEPVCFATKPFRTEIAPPRTVSPITGDNKPEEGWWQGTLYRLQKGKYKKFKTTPWARAQLQGGTAVPGVTIWRNQTGKQAFPNTVSVKAKKGRYVWKGNIYWVRSGGQVFAPIEPHIIRAKTVKFNKQCVF